MSSALVPDASYVITGLNYTNAAHAQDDANLREDIVSHMRWVVCGVATNKYLQGGTVIPTQAILPNRLLSCRTI